MYHHLPKVIILQKDGFFGWTYVTQDASASQESGDNGDNGDEKAETFAWATGTFRHC